MDLPFNFHLNVTTTLSCTAESLFQRNLLQLFSTAAKYDSEKLNRCSTSNRVDLTPQSNAAVTLYNAQVVPITVTQNRNLVVDNNAALVVPMSSEADVVTVAAAADGAGDDESDDSSGSSSDSSSGSSSDDDSDDDETIGRGGSVALENAVVDTTVGAVDQVATSVTAEASTLIEVGMSGNAAATQSGVLEEEDSSSGSDDDDEASTVQGETEMVANLESAPVLFVADEKAPVTADGDSTSDSDSNSSDDEEDDVKDVVTALPVDAVQPAAAAAERVGGVAPSEAAESSDDESGSSSDEDSDEEETETAVANQGAEASPAVTSTVTTAIDAPLGQVAPVPSVSVSAEVIPAVKGEEAVEEDDSSSSDSDSDDDSGTETETEEDERKKALPASPPALLPHIEASKAAVNADVNGGSSSGSEDDSSDADGEEDFVQPKDDTAPVPAVQLDAVTVTVTKDVEEEAHETVTIFGASNGGEDSSSDDDSDAETEDEAPEVAATPAVVTAPVAAAAAISLPLTSTAPVKIGPIPPAPKSSGNESDSSSSSEDDSGDESEGGNQQAPKKPPLALMVCRKCPNLTQLHYPCNRRQPSNHDYLKLLCTTATTVQETYCKVPQLLFATCENEAGEGCRGFEKEELRRGESSRKRNK
jgi:hypothetical protein